MGARRVLGAVVGGLLLSGIAGLIWGAVALDRRRARMEGRLAELRGGTRCTTRIRLPRAAPIPGDAWVHYARALEASAFSRNETAVVTRSGVRLGIDPDGVRRLLALQEQSFRELALGARSSELGAPPKRSPEEGQRIGDLESNLVWLCAQQARKSLREGRLRSAAEPLLDLTRWCMDREERGRNDRTAAFSWQAFEEAYQILVEIVRHPSLSPPDAADLELQLETLDRGFPCYLASMEQGIASVGEMLHDEDDAMRAMVGLATDERSWRYLFSTSLLRQSAFFHYDSDLRQVTPLHEGPFEALVKACNSVQYQEFQSSNPIVAAFALADLFSNPPAREAHARIRLLRLACAWRARGEILEHPDPLGMTLHHWEDGERVVLWSGERKPRDPRRTIELLR